MTIGPVSKKSVKKGGEMESLEEVGSMSDGVPSLPPPPDGGWGWVVVFASFMIHIIADGITYTFGIFFVEFVHYYEEGKGATSWIASILVGMTLGCGPIASALTNKYGCRAVTIAGSILASTGFILSVFAANITTLYFTIGICVGLGFGLIYLPAIVCVTCYFEKRRAFATGIAVCGSGLGTFIFAPLTEFLVEKYGWKGAMLLVAGFVLNCSVFGALFRPPEMPRPAAAPVKSHQHQQQNGLLGGKHIKADPGVDSPSPPPKMVVKSMDIKRVVDQTLRRSETANGHLVAVIDDDNNQISPPQKNGYMSLSVICNDVNKKSMSAMNLAERPPIKREGSSQSLVWKETIKSPESLPGPFYRKDVFYRGSLLNIPQYRSNPSMYTASITHIPPPEPKPSNPSKISGSCCFSKEARDALKEMMDFGLLADPVFVFFAISNFCTSIGFNVPYVYIKDRALLLGISSDESSFLLAIIGISNTISRVVLGYISDKAWLNRLWLYNTALTLCGMSTALSSFCLDYPSQAFYTTVYGATAGAYVGLTSVILVDLLGLEKLTNAFGLLLLFQGIAALIGPPIAGWLYDGLQSYSPGFSVAGTMIALSGAMLFAIPMVQRCAEKRKWWETQAQKSAETPAILEGGLGIPAKPHDSPDEPQEVTLELEKVD